MCIRDRQDVLRLAGRAARHPHQFVLRREFGDR